MSVAVIGVVALQTNLTMKSIRANEDAFDKNIQNALSVVATRIEKASMADDLLVVANGYSAEYLQLEGIGGDAVGAENGGMSIPTNISSRDLLSDQLLAQLIANSGEGLCDDCRRRHRLGLGFQQTDV